MEKIIEKETKTIIRHEATEVAEYPEIVFVRTSKKIHHLTSTELVSSKINEITEEQNNENEYNTSCFVEKTELLNASSERLSGMVANPFNGNQDMVLVALTEDDIFRLQQAKNVITDFEDYDFLTRLTTYRRAEEYPLPDGVSLYRWDWIYCLLTTLDGKVVPLPIQTTIVDDFFNIAEIEERIKNNSYVLQYFKRTGWAKDDNSLHIRCLFPQEVMQKHVEAHAGRILPSDLINEQLGLNEFYYENENPER